MIKSGMIQRWKYLLCGILLLGVGSLNLAAGQSTPVLPPSTRQIQLYLTATGKDESLVIPDHKALSVSIDKQPAQVISVHSAREQKLLFAVLVDISRSNSVEADQVKSAALKIFQGLSTNDSKGYLVVFNERIVTSEEPLEAAEAEQVLKRAQFEAGTSLYDAIGQTCLKTLNRSANPASFRRVIILLSDGGDNASNMSFLNADEACQAEGVSIFSFETGSTDHIQRYALRLFSQETGGEFTPKKNHDGVKSLLAAIDRQWAVSLAPIQEPDQKLHACAVKTAHKGVQISAPTHISIE